MVDIRSNWTRIKELIDGEQITLSYLVAAGNYYIYSSELPSKFILVCVVEEGTEDAIDFENNYKDNSTQIL